MRLVTNCTMELSGQLPRCRRTRMADWDMTIKNKIVIDNVMVMQKV